ncbi:MAG: hypothetical protein KDA33_02660, partial [Phycisphaerales bacterium]|nr:hypothetical protein [Phycisphaerales bacterium]
MTGFGDVTAKGKELCGTPVHLRLILARGVSHGQDRLDSHGQMRLRILEARQQEIRSGESKIGIGDVRRPSRLVGLEGGEPLDLRDHVLGAWVGRFGLTSLKVDITADSLGVPDQPHDVHIPRLYLQQLVGESQGFCRVFERFVVSPNLEQDIRQPVFSLQQAELVEVLSRIGLVLLLCEFQRRLVFPDGLFDAIQASIQLCDDQASFDIGFPAFHGVQDFQRFIELVFTHQGVREPSRKATSLGLCHLQPDGGFVVRTTFRRIADTAQFRVGAQGVVGIWRRNRNEFFEQFDGP